MLIILLSLINTYVLSPADILYQFYRIWIGVCKGQNSASKTGNLYYSDPFALVCDMVLYYCKISYNKGQSNT